VGLVVSVCPVVLLRGKGVRVSTPFITRFPGYLSHGTDLFTYLPSFNTTTLIKLMNEEEEDASHVHQNCLTRERHATRSEE
jgi:hypothetical protein